MITAATPSAPIKDLLGNDAGRGAKVGRVHGDFFFAEGELAANHLPVVFAIWGCRQQ